MGQIKNWEKTQSGSKLKWRNRETSAMAVVARAPDSYRYKWIAGIYSRRYPITDRGFDKKSDAKDYLIGKLRSNSEPEVECRQCGGTDVHMGGKGEGMGVDKVWYDCAECDYEGESRIVYAEVIR